LQYIQVHRVQPESQKGYLLVVHTAFNKGSKDRGQSEYSLTVILSKFENSGLAVSPIKLRRTRAKFIFGAHIEISSYEIPEDPEIFCGLPSKLVNIPSIVTPQRLDAEGPYTEIIVPDYFPPGSFLLFETQVQDTDTELDAFCTNDASLAFSDLDLIDLNVVLYRSNGEESDITEGEFGVYEVPGLGKLVYCGLEGWMHALRHIIRYNDLGHPLCAHLREGTWALDYVHKRLERYAHKRYSVLCCMNDPSQAK
jgi:glycogen debranching enzyme